MNALSNVSRQILQRLSDAAVIDLQGKDIYPRLDNVLLGKTMYTMKESNTVFTDMNFCLILLENAYGFSYFQEEIDYSLSKYVNCSIYELLEDSIPQYLRVALVDGLYCQINADKFAVANVFKGDLRQKATQRARLLFTDIPHGAKLVIFGVATEIIEEAMRTSCQYLTLDLEPQKIGLMLMGSEVMDARNYDLEEVIAWADYILATGMLFVSHSADEIINLANMHGTKIVLYMESGSNFGPQLTGMGVDAVLSERFPFYDFFGDTQYLYTRKVDNQNAVA